MNAVNDDLKQPDKYFKILLRKCIRRHVQNLVKAQNNLSDSKTMEFLKSIDHAAFWKLYEKHRASKYIKDAGRQ
jgi:ferritin